MNRLKLLFAICTAGALFGSLQNAAAQFQLPFALPWSTGSVPSPAQAPKPASPSDWSGQPGSSGHPLMTTEAILAAAGNFSACLEGLWPDAAKRGVTRATFDTYTNGLTPDLRIMDLMDTQPEFTKAFWDYLDLLVSENRIKRGREILAQYRAVFDAVEKAYGVDRNAVTAIWGIESNFGTSGGDRPVVRSTATLACVGRRQA
jgi:membrane-bound lytic murein transglycosylase B